MSQFAVCSVKGAPGATTLALAMACAKSSAAADAVLVEADCAGGDLAALLGLHLDPGIVSLAAACRHHSAVPDPRTHGQRLPAGGWALVGSTDPTQASAALSTLVPRLRAALDDAAANAVVDCGRWTPSTPTAPLLREMTATAVCLRSSIGAIEAVRVRAADLWEATGGRVGLVLVGQNRYRADQIEACTRLPVIGEVPWDRRGHARLCGAATGKPNRSPMVRAAEAIAARLEGFGSTTRTAPLQQEPAGHVRSDGASR